MTITEIEEILRTKQNTHRFRHTLGVQCISIALAMRYGEDINKASLAGLLHDCAKHLSSEKLLKKAKKYQLPINETEHKSPFLLHAKVGAAIAKEKYGIDDPAILNAISWHTTGRPDMSLLEKIVFTADYIEPGRSNAPNLDTLRQMAFIDLDKTVLMILEQTLDYLKSTTKDIETTTEKTFQYYLEHVNRA